MGLPTETVVQCKPAVWVKNGSAPTAKPFLERAYAGAILVVGQIKHDLDEALGRPMSLSSAYTLLHRHNWRKLAPDKRHPQSDHEAQEEWKKTPPTALRSLQKTGKVSPSD